MELFYPEEHINCCHYSKFNKRLNDGGQAITDYRFEAGDVREQAGFDTEIIFMLDGECVISGNGIANLKLKKGNAILMPIGQKYTAHMETPSRMLICLLPISIDLCDTYSLKHLYKDRSEAWKCNDYSLLAMNDRLWTFATNVADCMGDGLKCTKFLAMKITEMMFLFRVYYTKEVLADFFSPVLNKDMEFANIILENWAIVKNKSDLATLVKLSPSRFGVKFKEVFGMAPYQWLMNQRSERIYHELVYTNNSFRQISEDFRFGSVQHFNDFCKKQFGKTPGQIRES